MDANASKMRPKPIETRGTDPFLLDFIGVCGFHGKYFEGSSPVSCSIETQKDIRKDVFFVFTSPAGARGFEVSAPLRSAQSGRPPDVLRRLVLLPKARKHCKINASGFFAESKDIRTI